MVLSSNKLHHFFSVYNIMFLPNSVYGVILKEGSIFWETGLILSASESFLKLHFWWSPKAPCFFYLTWKQIYVCDVISTSWQVLWHNRIQLHWFQWGCMNYIPGEYVALQLLLEWHKGLRYRTKRSFSNFSQKNMQCLALATQGKTSIYVIVSFN